MLTIIINSILNKETIASGSKKATSDLQQKLHSKMANDSTRKYDLHISELMKNRTSKINGSKGLRK